MRPADAGCPPSPFLIDEHRPLGDLITGQHSRVCECSVLAGRVRRAAGAVSSTCTSRRGQRATSSMSRLPLHTLAHPLRAHPDSHLIYDPLQVNLSHRHGAARQAAAIDVDELLRQPTPGSCASAAWGGAEQLGAYRRDDGERGCCVLWPCGTRTVRVSRARQLQEHRDRCGKATSAGDQRPAPAPMELDGRLCSFRSDAEAVCVSGSDATAMHVLCVSCGPVR